jgi:hypothetical protein
MAGEGARTPTRVFLTALAPDDSVAFDGPVAPTGFNLPAAAGVAAEPPVEAAFDARPGTLRIRMRLEDASGRPLDLDVRTVPVPDFQKGLSISTPEVLRARNAREFRALGNSAAIPASSRVFSRTEHLLIRFRAYAPEGAPSMAAQLLNVAGQVSRLLDIQAGPDGTYRIDLPLAGFAAGDYELDLRASSGGSQIKERLPLRVTS